MTRSIFSIVGLFVGASIAKKLVGRFRYSYQGKVVVISGGSRGLGLVLARQLVAEGARVAILSRDFGRIEEAAKEFEEHEFFAVECDVASSRQVHAAIEEVRGHFGKIDVVIHNAGVMQVGPFETMRTEDYKTSLSTHFWGAYNLVRECKNDLEKSPSARMIFVDSIGGKVGVPHMAPYTVGKFALAGFAESIRAELAELGISLTTAYPAVIRTGSPYNVLFKGDSEKERLWFTLLDSMPGISLSAERAARMILDGARLGTPEVFPGWVSKVAVTANGLAPNLFARGNRVLAKMLPEGSGNTRGTRGHELPPSPALERGAVLTNLAAIANNEL